MSAPPTKPDTRPLLSNVSKVQLLDQRRDVVGVLLKGKIVAGAILLFGIVVT
jgi:hypothetical protein